MSELLFQVAVLVILLVINGLFALAEMAIVSARKTKLQEMAEAGDLGARTALDLSDSPDTFLPAVQIGVTGIGVGAGALGGAELGEKLSVLFVAVGISPRTASAVSIGLVVALITFGTLVIGELIPKRIALLYPEKCAALLSRPLKLFSSVFSHLVRVLNASTEFVLSIVPTSQEVEPTVSTEEIKLIVEQAAESGVVGEAEEVLMKKVLLLDDLKMSDLMTPRRDIFWIDINAPWHESWKKIVTTGHSYIPLGDGSVEKFLGLLSVKDALKADLGADSSIEAVRKVMKQAHIVHENITALQLVEQFKTKGTHVAMVVDEHGGIEGMVTLHDLVAALVGVVPNSADHHAPLCVRRDDGSFLVDPGIHLDELRETLDLRDPMTEEESHNTLRALIFNRVSHVPTEGQHFIWHGYRFEIIDMDGRRIDKVLIEKVAVHDGVKADV